MTGRQIRVAAAIRREIAELVLLRMRDPRLAQVTITGVEVSRDFSVAKVFVSRLGDDEARREAVAALNDAAGFVRRSIAPLLQLRTVPELQFRPDDTAARAQHLETLFRSDADEFGAEPTPSDD
ncbi:MAG: 30S ribosome-binding factor RbfA [Armatimonadetes bacterium]|nr:30S ribosome-binding factor RbfA [Armatimonadota bacterium]